MAVQDYKINYKSDFVLTINGDAGWAVPFCIKFWTGMPSQAYFVGFDGVKYVNCRLGDTPTQLLVMFDDHHLPIGKLKMQIAYHTTIAEFPGSVFDEVTNARDVIVTIDGTDYQVLLDFTGEDAPELEFDLPAYANEAERIQNELQRQQNEAARIEAELEREQASAAAVAGAENVNAQLSGNILTVTNRNGVSTSVNTKGEQGEQGPVGPEGPQGQKGVSITGLVKTGETDTDTLYNVTFSDGHTQDVAIPKGAKGDTGATGPQGPQGDTGVSITSFTYASETETDMIYTVTFSDSTTQQVAIPKGEQGDRGPAGPTGPQGPKGDTVILGDGVNYTLYNTTGQNTDGAMTQQAVTNNFSRIESRYNTDLDITDDDNNILARFADGHFRTKNFNSKDIQCTTNVNNDFAISDENGYSIVQFGDGNIKTKNFDSSEVNLKVKYSEDDFSITDESGYQIVTFIDGNIKTKNFDSSEISIKYVDCLGDSLTMGFTSSGWYEPSLQESLGSKYTVRNWGVGGEKGSTIMTRLGAAQVVFPQSFVLPADGTAVQIATHDNPMVNTFNGIAFTPLLQGTQNDQTLKTRVINPCYIDGIECTMEYLGDDYYAQSPYILRRNDVGDRDVTVSPHTQIYLNTGKQMAHSYISIVWIGENKEISGQFDVDEVVLMNKTIAKYLSNTRYIFIGLHKLTGATASDYESKMMKQFGNKFFNLREYACTNMIYDCGLIPTAQDLEDMANGICPSSLLLDYSHFTPLSNEIIGQKLGEICKQLGYLNN